MNIRRCCTSLTILMILAAMVLVPVTRAEARDSQEISKTPPVAIVAGVTGEVFIKYPNKDWQKAFALDLLGPETMLRTGGNGRITTIFFYDDHREIMMPMTEARTSFRNLEKTAGEIRREVSKSGGNEFNVPYVMQLKLIKEMFKPAALPGESEKETDFLSAYVKVTAYPPVFIWRDMGAQAYRLQLFNEREEFIYETKLDKPMFKFPYKPPFRLIKSGLYFWQVLDARDQVLVRKYGFKLLTKPQVKFLSQMEGEFERLQRGQKGEQTSYTQLFLVYNQYHTLDKLVHHLQTWRDLEPDNPNIYRALARAYLIKGCPLRAREALEQEIRLGQPDPVAD